MWRAPRTAKLLTSPGLAPTSNGVAEKLARKHPQRHYDTAKDQHAESFSPIELSEGSFLTAVNTLPSGSGTGPSGWQYEHLQILAEFESTEKGLSYLFNDCQSHLCINPSFSISPTCYSEVKRSVRRIAIGELLRQSTAKIICI